MEIYQNSINPHFSYVRESEKMNAHIATAKTYCERVGVETWQAAYIWNIFE